MPNNPNTTYASGAENAFLLVDKWVDGDYKTESHVMAGLSPQATEIKQGTPLAKITTVGHPDEGKVVLYDAGGADGEDTCIGLLANNVLPINELERTDATGATTPNQVQVSIFVPGGGGRFVYAVLTALGVDATIVGQLNGAVSGDYFSM